MEHSVEAYFDRCSTENLKWLLCNYCDEEEELYQYYASLIKEILKKRSACGNNERTIKEVY